MDAKSPVRFRKLRLVWSVAWGIVAVLFVVLWVRSYEIYENATVLVFQASSGRGQLAASLDTYHRIKLISYTHQPASDAGVYSNKSVYEMMLFSSWHGFAVSTYRPVAVLVPHWFGILLATAAAARPCVHFKQFPLRSLLLATTLVAVLLGLVVWAVR